MAIALAIAYAWVTTEFSLSMSLLAALTWLVACCAEATAADAPDGAGSPGGAQRGEVVIKRSDVPARNRDGISELVEVVLEAAVNVVLDGAALGGPLPGLASCGVGDERLVRIVGDLEYDV